MKVKCLRSCSVFTEGKDRTVQGFLEGEEFTIRKDSSLAEVLREDRNFEILDNSGSSKGSGSDETEDESEDEEDVDEGGD